MAPLRVLAVDDEPLALSDLAWLLDQTDGVGEVVTAPSGADALRILNDRDDIDALFLDIQMPGLDGVELVKVLRHFKEPPSVAFVTAFDRYAVDAFDLDVVDYLLKPVAADRLAETVRRMRERCQEPVADHTPSGGDLATLTAKRGDVTHVIDRDDVMVVEAAGDYVRLHQPNADGPPHLARVSISTLTSAWARHGFIRVHRSFLVRGSAIREVRTVDGRRTLVLVDREVPVARRYHRLLQDHLGRT